MSERKPEDQSWESFTEQQIQAAQAAGAFENLPGKGEPLPGIDEPLEEDWWIKRKLRDEHASILPPLLEARRDIEKIREEIRLLRSESLVRRVLEELRQRVDVAIHSPHPSPPVAILPIDVDDELARWRKDRVAHRMDC